MLKVEPTLILSESSKFKSKILLLLLKSKLYKLVSLSPPWVAPDQNAQIEMTGACSRGG